MSYTRGAYLGQGLSKIIDKEFSNYCFFNCGKFASRVLTEDLRQFLSQSNSSLFLALKAPN